MAEISISSGSKTSNRRNKNSVRVDLTPMVDLGFILITFFIFTTSMSEPKSMKVKFPDDRGIVDSTRTLNKKTLNFILAGNDRTYYYHGDDISTMLLAGGENQIRSIIHDKRKAIATLYADPDEIVVLIKPAKESSYRNVVDMLDEMLITGVKRHVLMEPNAEEIRRIR